MVKQVLWVWLVLGALVGCDKEPVTPVDPAKTEGAPAGDGKDGAPSAATTPATTTPPGAIAPPAATMPPATAPPPAATDGGVAVAAAPEGFKVGDKVYGKWTDGRWYPGKIAKVNDNGTFNVNYNDGDVSKNLPKSKVKARTASKGGGGSSSGGCGGGLTKCGGRCVDLLNDPKNCFDCGRQCPEACMGGSCVSNSYKYGP